MVAIGLRLFTLAPALVSAALDSARSVAVQGRTILVDGEAVHLKGVNWNPVPLGGRESIDPDGMFHSDADFLGAVTQDAALMQAAGINAVRTYTLVTDRAVLDVLQEHGIHLLNTVYRGHEDLDVEVGRIQEVMDHPAILMWVIGNEWNDQHCYASLTHEQCRERIKEGVRRVKAADATRPVATVYGKLPSKDTVADLEGVGVESVWGGELVSIEGRPVGRTNGPEVRKERRPTLCCRKRPHGARIWR